MFEVSKSYSFRNSQVKQADICADIVQISAQKIGN